MNQQGIHEQEKEGKIPDETINKLVEQIKKFEQETLKLRDEKNGIGTRKRTIEKGKNGFGTRKRKRIIAY